MDKNAIKKYAAWARRELISRVSQKAEYYGVTAEENGDVNADSIDGRVLSADEKKQRLALIRKVRRDGFEQAMEEAAYTWFNRFSALRYMEANNYLPTRTRVFTNAEGEFKPQILDEAIHLEMDGLDMEKVYMLKEANETEALYRYLLITQCNALSKIMPVMFQKIDDYTQLLLPDYLLREGSVIEQMVTTIPEEDWKDQVQIIGWLYQYYNSEKKDEVFAALKKNVKITKENIPAATQLFTPDWIVRYMVENSLGRLWIERTVGSGQCLVVSDEKEKIRKEKELAEGFGWKYYLEEAEQEPEVEAQLAEIRKEYAALKPEDILCIDPCVGSGHILDYIFDVLMQIYMDYGYTTTEAVRSIVENNLYGLDIDDRAAQLANFSVMMKARSYDRRFLTRKDENGKPNIPQPHVYAIAESNDLNINDRLYFTNDDPKLKKEFGILSEELYDAKEYGSILNVSQLDFAALYARIDEIRNDVHFNKESALSIILPMIQVAETLAQKYHVVVTNPPYMGSRKSMNPILKKYTEKHYMESKSDLYAVFIEKCISLSKQYGKVAMVTQHSFMFTDDYKELRKKILARNHFINMAHFGTDAFPEINGEVVQTTAFIISSNDNISEYRGVYSRLVDFTNEEKPIVLMNKGSLFTAQNSDFEGIKATPYSYWLSPQMKNSFLVGTPFELYGNPRAGITTGENERFMRNWFEVNFNKIGLKFETVEKFHSSGKLYIPYNKGGKQIKWYGNNDYVLMFDKKNYKILSNQGNHLPSRQYYCRKCITWSDISGRSFAARYCDIGTIFDVKGSCGFPKENNLWFSLAFLNSKLTPKYIDSLNPTTTTQVGDLKRIPIIAPNKLLHNRINELAISCVEETKIIYDYFETSWDFNMHPLVKYAKKNNICLAYSMWKEEAEQRYITVKTNEEEINRILIDVYGLQDEILSNVSDKDVTIRRADLQSDIKSLISYAVGCMFGRYSLDVEGLVYAGGEWDDSKYNTFSADKYNIIPVSEDEYFEDDIVNRFIDFVCIVYGKDTLEENLQFIAEALGGTGSPREVIRNYFINDFYKDHCKIYQKRPIYWLFDSGKKNGFKCLIYMHRYKPDTIARIRTDYVHEQQARYRTAIEGLKNQISNAAAGERVKLNKKLKKLQDQADELHSYEEKIHHLADRFISIDLDDGVKHNYEIFKDVLAKIK